MCWYFIVHYVFNWQGLQGLLIIEKISCILPLKPYLWYCTLCLHKGHKNTEIYLCYFIGFSNYHSLMKDACIYGSISNSLEVCIEVIILILAFWFGAKAFHSTTQSIRQFVTYGIWNKIIHIPSSKQAKNWYEQQPLNLWLELNRYEQQLLNLYLELIHAKLNASPARFLFFLAAFICFFLSLLSCWLPASWASAPDITWLTSSPADFLAFFLGTSPSVFLLLLVFIATVTFEAYGYWQVV